MRCNEFCSPSNDGFGGATARCSPCAVDDLLGVSQRKRCISVDDSLKLVEYSIYNVYHRAMVESDFARVPCWTLFLFKYGSLAEDLALLWIEQMASGESGKWQERRSATSSGTFAASSAARG